MAGRALLRDDEGVVDVEHQDGVGVVGRLGRVELADRDLVEAQHAAGLDDLRRIGPQERAATSENCGNGKCEIRSHDPGPPVLGLSWFGAGAARRSIADPGAGRSGGGALVAGPLPGRPRIGLAVAENVRSCTRAGSTAGDGAVVPGGMAPRGLEVDGGAGLEDRCVSSSVSTVSSPSRM